MTIYNFLTNQISINVEDKNDCAPTFDADLLEFNVTEDAQIGRIIGTIKAQDVDTIGSLSYKIIGGDQDKFSLNNKDGELKLIDTLDREMKEFHELKVQVSDGVHDTNATVQLRVRFCIVAH